MARKRERDGAEGATSGRGIPGGAGGAGGAGGTGRAGGMAEVVAERISAFRGHRLASIPAFGATSAMAAGAGGTSAPAALSRVGITDAEQLVAVAAVGDARPYLARHLGLSESALESAIQEARKVIAPPVLAALESPVVGLYGLGAHEPTPQMKAGVAKSALAAAPPADLPESTNLIAVMSPIRFQASRGTCVAFTLTAVNEYYRRALGVEVDLSEQHLYYETKLTDNAEADCGTFQAFASQVLADRGQCRESVWPYNPNPPCNNHGSLPDQARPDGANYLLQLEQLSPNDSDTVKARLADSRPVGISIPVYNSWYQSAETERTGRITLRLGDEPSVGGHAVCLVGYQDDATAPGGGYFIVRNHWSTTWGAQCPYGAGYGTIPYQYVSNDCWEAFALASDLTGGSGGDLEMGQEQARADAGGPSHSATQPGNKRRTVTITVKGDVNLVIG